MSSPNFLANVLAVYFVVNPNTDTDTHRQTVNELRQGKTCLNMFEGGGGGGGATTLTQG